MVIRAQCVAVSPCGNFGVIGYSSGHVDTFNMQSGLHRGSFAGTTDTGTFQLSRANFCVHIRPVTIFS